MVRQRTSKETSDVSTAGPAVRSRAQAPSFKGTKDYKIAKPGNLAPPMTLIKTKSEKFCTSAKLTLKKHKALDKFREASGLPSLKMSQSVVSTATKADTSAMQTDSLSTTPREFSIFTPRDVDGFVKCLETLAPDHEGLPQNRIFAIRDQTSDRFDSEERKNEYVNSLPCL